MARGYRMTRKNARKVLGKIADAIEADEDVAQVYRVEFARRFQGPTPLTRDTARVKLMDIAHHIEKAEVNGKHVVDDLNDMLDELLGQDFFGTEGQCDPRGDRRDL